jgi:hypothetical protein
MQSYPALAACGGQPDPVYVTQVARLVAALQSNPPHVRPESRTRSSMTDTASPGKFVIYPASLRLVPESEDWARHIEAASELPFPLQAARGGTMDTDVVEAIEHMIHMGAAAPAWRDAQTRILSSVAEALSDGELSVDAQLKRAACPKENVRKVAGAVNVAFICALSDAMEWPDTGLSEGMLKGFKTLGVIPPTNLYREKVLPESVNDFLARSAKILNPQSNMAWTKDLRRSLQSQGRHAFAAGDGVELAALRKLEEVTDGEVTAGMLGLPLTFRQLTKEHADFKDGQARPLRRFGVPKGLDGVRPIDDGKASSSNEATRVAESLNLPRPEWFALCAAEFHRAAKERGEDTPELSMALDDVSNAFRQIPTGQPEYTVVAIFSVKHGADRYYPVFGHNFGLVSAVINFCRLPRFITAVTARWLSVAATAYYDDYLCCDTAASNGSAQVALAAVHKLVNVPLAPKKRKIAAQSHVALGVQVSMAHASETEGYVEFTPQPGRAEALLRDLQACRTRATLLPQEAMSFLGQLIFLLFTCAGRVGRAAVLPLVQRAHRDVSCAWTLSLEVMLTFFYALFAPGNQLPRRIYVSCAAGWPIHVYTDASFSWKGAFLGICLVDPSSNERWYASLEVPAWIMVRLSRNAEWCINQLELIACLAARVTFRAKLAGRQVVAWCDNCSALSACVHGYSNKEDLAHIASLYHLALSADGSDTYHLWVPSKANVADLPTHPSPENWRLLSEQGFREIPMVLPPQELWDAPMRFMNALLGQDRWRELEL